MKLARIRTNEPEKGLLIIDLDRIESIHQFDEVRADGTVCEVVMHSHEKWRLDEQELTDLRTMLPQPAFARRR